MSSGAGRESQQIKEEIFVIFALFQDSGLRSLAKS
jgi:hypothetical protein